MKLTRNKSTKLRFAGVGAISTAIDFGVLFLLHFFGITSILANFISTGLGFCFSFFANKKYTFKASNGSSRKQFILFFIVTFTGIWGIQPIIIWGVSTLLQPMNWQDWMILFVSKILATGVTLLWNYFFYSRFVFPTKEREEQSA